MRCGCARIGSLIAIVATWMLIGNCGKVCAGFLAANVSNSNDSLVTSEINGLGESAGPLQTAPCESSEAQPRDVPFSSPDPDEGPLAGRKLPSQHFGILTQRESSSSGAGSTNSTSSTGSGQPLVGSSAAMVSAPQGPTDNIVDPHIVRPRSIASRLFRPPRS